VGLGAVGQKQMWCNSVGFASWHCTSFDFAKRGFVLSFSFCRLMSARWSVRVADNGQSLLLCWYFLMSSPEPLLIEKLMMKITTKADRIPSAGYRLIAI